MLCPPSCSEHADACARPPCAHHQSSSKTTWAPQPEARKQRLIEQEGNLTQNGNLKQRWRPQSSECCNFEFGKNPNYNDLSWPYSQGSHCIQTNSCHDCIKVMIQLMVQNSASPVEVGTFFPIIYQGFKNIPAWCRISSINS